MDEAGTAVWEGFELLGGLLRAGERTDCSGQALAEGFELLGVVLKRAPHMGCTMLSVEGMRESRLQRVSVELVGLPDSKRHSTWGA